MTNGEWRTTWRQWADRWPLRALVGLVLAAILVVLAMRASDDDAPVDGSMRSDMHMRIAAPWFGPVTPYSLPEPEGS